MGDALVCVHDQQDAPWGRILLQCLKSRPYTKIVNQPAIEQVEIVVQGVVWCGAGERGGRYGNREGGAGLDGYCERHVIAVVVQRDVGHAVGVPPNVVFQQHFGREREPDPVFVDGCVCEPVGQACRRRFVGRLEKIAEDEAPVPVSLFGAQNRVVKLLLEEIASVHVADRLQVHSGGEQGGLVIALEMRQ